jgi:hypothetical protein
MTMKMIGPAGVLGLASIDEMAADRRWNLDVIADCEFTLPAARRLVACKLGARGVSFVHDMG